VKLQITEAISSSFGKIEQMRESRVGGVSAISGSLEVTDRHGHELFLNHVWESLNTAAKILFFVVVTPLMLASWDKERFGLFALANSSVALMVVFDLGLRALTRVALSNNSITQEEKVRRYAANIAAFVLASTSALSLIFLLALNGCWGRWLHLPVGGDFVMVAAPAIAACTMLLQLLVEPVAAEGFLSRIKANLFVGNLIAFGIVLAALRIGASVAVVTVLYLGTLALPLLFLLPAAHVQTGIFGRPMTGLKLEDILSAFRLGSWNNVLNLAWLLQGYGLLFLISILIDPVQAGIFFLYLKLTEMLSVLGASTTEPTIAALASASTSAQRRRRFNAAYKSAAALCLTGAVAYTFFCSDLLRLWLGRSLDNPFTGLLIALFGLSAAFTRMVTAACIGLDRPRPAAIGALAGALVTTAGVSALYHRVGTEGVLLIGAGSGLFLVPAAVAIARTMGGGFLTIWIKPVKEFAPSLVVIASLCWLAADSANLSAIILAVLTCALICIRHIFRQSLTQLGDENGSSTPWPRCDTLLAKCIDYACGGSHPPFSRTKSISTG